MFASLSNPDDNKLGNAVLEQNNIDVVVDKAVKINRENKFVETDKGDKYSYEKLILAIGSTPIMLPIDGIDKKGVYQVYKNMDYLKVCVEKIKSSQKVLVIGGGFIGVEFADEISKLKAKSIYLVEMLPNILSNSFDVEFSNIAKEKLKSQGINVLTNTRVEAIIGKDKVEKVKFSDGQEIEFDSIILGVGAIPNIQLAVEAGLNATKGKGIWTDEYMRTADPDIFAIGDCACKKDFYTRRDISVMLASTATAEARIAGANLYQLKLIRENQGTIAIYSTYISGLVLSSAGLTELTAKKEGFEVVVSTVDGVDKHPGTLPEASKSKLKLIFSKHSGVLLGGQVSCGMACAQMINIIGIAIQKRMSSTELETLQFATHPYLTSSPTAYPIVLAAQEASRKV
jgi:NADPH-dependent 2,4-dienoyl-CoA reductase/sulfur reductase-like enzyme